VLRQPRYALLTAPILVITCWFAASYDNARIDRYYLVPLLIALTWIALLVAAAIDGLERLLVPGRLDRRGSRVRSPLVAIGLAGLIVIPTLLVLPDRWRAVDQSGVHEASDWLDAILDERITGRDAVILSWWSYSTPLWYAQHVEGRRPDIRIVDDRTRLDEDLGEIADVIDANLGRRPVIVIQTDPEVIAALASQYRLTLLEVPGPQAVYRVDAALAGVGR
jgi:hypothetical protein